jgi:hypothetical protein
MCYCCRLLQKFPSGAFLYEILGEGWSYELVTAASIPEKTTQLPVEAPKPVCNLPRQHFLTIL